MNIIKDSITTWRQYWPKHWLEQELIWLLATLLAGVVVLPALTYLVGSHVFGAYQTGGGLVAFYRAFSRDLADAHLNAWIVALGPLLLVYMLRLILGLLPFELPLWRKDERKSPQE